MRLDFCEILNKRISLHQEIINRINVEIPSLKIHKELEFKTGNLKAVDTIKDGEKIIAE